MAAPGQPRAPVATGGFLLLMRPFYSYNFIYSRFPPTARSGPSSPSRARLSSSSSGCFLGRKGIRDRYREEPFPRTPFLAVGGGEKGYQFGGRGGARCGVTLWPPVGRRNREEADCFLSQARLSSVLARGVR